MVMDKTMMVMLMAMTDCLQVVFLSPANLLATSLANSSVEVVWEESRGGWRADIFSYTYKILGSKGGWRAPSRQLRVEDEAMPGRRLVEREIGAGAGSVLLEGFLQEEKTYILTFSPTGPRVPQDIGQVNVHILTFCNWA